ncbi:MAG: DUF4101 domain-containing protein, partial [Leptolyngbya sp. SIO1D8]|nr:DUF4101 domain-containing protein [Leptolyngbya sp. SIO1D8]
AMGAAATTGIFQQVPLTSTGNRETPAPTYAEEPPNAEGNLSIAERVSQLSPEGQLQSRRSPHNAPAPTPIQNGHRPSAAVDPSRVVKPARRSRSPRWDRLAGVLIAGMLAIGTLGFITIRTLSWVSAALTGPKLQRPVLDIGLTSPPITIPTPPPPEAQISTEDIAKGVIDGWLAAKREALSQTHNVAALETILIDPAFTQWRNRANGAQRDNWYVTYEHTVEILNVEPNDPSAEALTVDAQVREVAEYYELGIRNLSNSYDETLNMQYNLVRQGGEWFVKDMTKLD